MAEIVEVDKSGRIVLPKKLREQLSIQTKTKLLLIQRNGNLTLTPINIDDIARKLETELGDTDVEGIAKQIRREINDKIQKQHPELSARQ
jgi:AbrB family looped-hinge helix DNA binding protein